MTHRSHDWKGNIGDAEKVAEEDHQISRNENEVT